MPVSQDNMDEIPFSNREITEKFTNIETLIREKHDDQMTAIGSVRIQTTATNGRVRWQEKMIYAAMGGIAVIMVVLWPQLESNISQTQQNSNRIAALNAQIKSIADK